MLFVYFFLAIFSISILINSVKLKERVCTFHNCGLTSGSILKDANFIFLKASVSHLVNVFNLFKRSDDESESSSQHSVCG